MVGELDFDTVRDFATALLIGTLLGIERERHKQSDGDISVGGLRTFILLAMLGAIGGWLTKLLDFPWILVAVVLATLVAVVASYVLAARVQPDALGLTTELAAIAICLLGAMVMLGHREIAVALAIAIAAALAYKQPLHGMVSRLGCGGCLRRRATARGDVHRPAAAARSRYRSLGRAQPAEALAAGAADLGAVAGGLRGGAPAGPESRHTAHRSYRRARFLHRGHAVVRQAEPREGSCALGTGLRLRHPDRVGRHVPARACDGADRQPRAAAAPRRALPGDGGRRQRASPG